MGPLRVFDGLAAPMPAANIDTDQILPARFLSKLRSDGLGPCLFRDLRFSADHAERPDFVLNRPPYRDARILVAGPNFGCGSSREAAVYALYDGGFRAVVSASFGDIFQANCLKNGLLPVVLPDNVVGKLLIAATNRPGLRITINLEGQTVATSDAEAHRFQIDGMRKRMLLQGIDEIDYTLGLTAQIAEFERRTARSLEGRQS
jgi:3-isopropylmalate/(R)-2-methylmalate dehydratase small subunit